MASGANSREAFLDTVPPDVWLKKHWTGDEPNVTGAERWLSLASGIGLAVLGGAKRGPIGAVAGVAGAALALRALTGHCPIKAAQQKATPDKQAAEAQGWSGAALAHRAVTVNRSRQDCYDTWRDFSNLAQFMENIESIEVRDERTSHWVVQAPLGRTVQWDAIVTEDVPGERIAWETAPGADVQSFGWVEFKDGPQGRGTEVRARLAYKPPAGAAGVMLAKVLQREPNVQVRRDLKRFKSFMETGEIARSHVPGTPARADA